MNNASIFKIVFAFVVLTVGLVLSSCGGQPELVFTGHLVPTPDTSIKLGYRAYVKGNYETAIAHYTEAIENEEWHHLNPKAVEKAFCYRGMAYGGLGKHVLAIEDFNKAIGLAPKYVDAFVNRGVAYEKLGKYDLSISDYSKAIALDPSNASAYKFRGSSYIDRKQYDLAIYDLNKALEIYPEYAIAYNDRAVAYYHKGRYTNAQQDIDRAKNLGFRPNPQFLKLLSERLE